MLAVSRYFCRAVCWRNRRRLPMSAAASAGTLLCPLSYFSSGTLHPLVVPGPPHIRSIATLPDKSTSSSIVSHLALPQHLDSPLSSLLIATKRKSQKPLETAYKAYQESVKLGLVPDTILGRVRILGYVRGNPISSGVTGTNCAFELAGISPRIDNPLLVPIQASVLTLLAHPDYVVRPSSTRVADLEAVLISIVASLGFTPVSFPLLPLSIPTSNHSSFPHSSIYLQTILSALRALLPHLEQTVISSVASSYVDSVYRSQPLNTRMDELLEVFPTFLGAFFSPSWTDDPLARTFVLTALARIVESSFKDVSTSSTGGSMEKFIIKTLDSVQAVIGDVEFDGPASKLLYMVLAQANSHARRFEQMCAVVDRLEWNGPDSYGENVLTFCSNRLARHIESQTPCPDAVSNIRHLCLLLDRFDTLTQTQQDRSPDPFAYLTDIFSKMNKLDLSRSSVKKYSLSSDGSITININPSVRASIIEAEQVIGAFIESRSAETKKLFVSELLDHRIRALGIMVDFQGVVRLWNKAMNEGLPLQGNSIAYYVRLLPSSQRASAPSDIPSSQPLLDALALLESMTHPTPLGLVRSGIDTYLSHCRDCLRNHAFSSEEDPIEYDRRHEQLRGDAKREVEQLFNAIHARTDVMDDELWPRFFDVFKYAGNWSWCKEHWRSLVEEDKLSIPQMMRLYSISLTATSPFVKLLDGAGFAQDKLEGDAIWSRARLYPNLDLNCWSSRLECLARLGDWPLCRSLVLEMFRREGSPPAPAPTLWMLQKLRRDLSKHEKKGVLGPEPYQELKELMEKEKAGMWAEIRDGAKISRDDKSDSIPRFMFRPRRP